VKLGQTGGGRNFKCDTFIHTIHTHVLLTTRSVTSEKSKQNDLRASDSYLTSLTSRTLQDLLLIAFPDVNIENSSENCNSIQKLAWYIAGKKEFWL
jgi:hypothetical protein